MTCRFFSYFSDLFIVANKVEISNEIKAFFVRNTNIVFCLTEDLTAQKKFSNKYSELVLETKKDLNVQATPAIVLCRLLVLSSTHSQKIEGESLW